MHILVAVFFSHFSMKELTETCLLLLLKCLPILPSNLHFMLFYTLKSYVIPFKCRILLEKVAYSNIY